jgi:peptidoglycan/LPS O-acetylase OafA/YrhL
MENRRVEIDGIRGWAALSVLLFHLFVEFFGALVPEFRNPLSRIFLNGGLAVAIFFVLSGDALSIAYLKNNSYRSLDSILVKRYFRLTIPILLSCAIVYALMRAGLTYNLLAAPVVHREDWLGTAINFQPNFIEMLRYSLGRVYIGHNLSVSYNPFLWTMSVEMFGSLVVMLYLYVSQRLRRPVATLWYAIIVLFLLRDFIALFLVGVLFGKLRVDGVFDRLLASIKWRNRLLLIVAGTCLCLVTIVDRGSVHVNMLAAAVLVFCFYSSRISIAFFSTRLSRFLGEISFPLYLVHFPVLCSLTSFLTIRASASGDLDVPHIIGIGLITIAVCIAASIVFRAIELRALRIIDMLPRRLFVSAEAEASPQVQVGRERV